jgi:glycosyltransferase involved in cell wall biosynthesis
MSEVWVPTDFHRDVFAASGVDPAKLVVVPEPVDTDLFDPLRHQPLPLPLDQRVFGPDWPHGGMAEDDEDGGPYGVAGDGTQDPFVWLSIFKWETRKVGARHCLHTSLPSSFQHAPCVHHAGLGPPAASLPDRLHGGRQRAAGAPHVALAQRDQLCRADAGKLEACCKGALPGQPPPDARCLDA